MDGFKKLEVFKKSYELALQIHKISLKFPKEIQFNLADQIRRSSRSIPTNIAEGYGKKYSQKDFRRFLLMAKGSKDETIVHLNFLKDLNYIDQKIFDFLEQKYEEVGKMLFGLIKSLKI